MGNVDRHAPGAFCWVELATTDQNAAKTFYGSLFGWTASDSQIGQDEVYTIFKLNGRDAAAAYTMRPEQMAQGVPPHWMLYVCVTNADESAAKAKEAGANVLAGPFDVMSHGRMAILRDPQGAVFSLWQPNQHVGVTIKDVDGTLCWVDLNTPDATAASGFYKKLFGWEFEPGDSGYLHIKNGSEMIGGIPPAGQQDPNVPPHFLPYFFTSNIGGIAGKAEAGGAKFCLPPTMMENVGTIAVVADPQGAAFALYQPVQK